MFAGARPRVPLPPAAAEGARCSARERTCLDAEVRRHAGQAALRARGHLQRRRPAVAARAAQTATGKNLKSYLSTHPT